MATVGFIGFGVMGVPMAENLVKSGFAVVGYDIDTECARKVSGVEIARSVAEVAEKCDRIVTMLPDSPHVESVTLGDGGLVAHLPEGAIIADMSTISPKTSRDIFQAAAEKGVRTLDAPVSGGRKGAVEGTLSIMVGGEQSAFDDFLPIFQAMGATIILTGPAGCGQTVKLCNQVMVAINIQAVCEAFALAKVEGMDLNVVRKVLMGGAANSWMLENLAPQMIAGDSSAGFRIGLQLKDLRLALETAMRDGVPMPAAGLATNMYLEAGAHGELNNGNQAMYRVYERLINRQFQ